MTRAVELIAIDVAKALEGDLRSDHAGEYGAVAISHGILATARWPEVREFASEHRQTEVKHLALMEQLVPPASRSRLLVVWRVSGWMLGALPAAISKQAAFATIAAVEQYVESHYRRQINRLAADEKASALRRLLIGTVDDIASAVCFLLTEQSSWITGQVLSVDGGMSRTRMLS